jgi:ankyrin repeat protein
MDPLRAFTIRDHPTRHGLLRTNKITDDDEPVVLAIKNHQIDIFRFLLKYDPAIIDRCNQPMKDGSTLLGLIATYGHSEMASMLLEHNVNPNVRDSSGCTPLYNAITKRNTSMVSILLHHDVDITVKVDDELPLLTAVKYRNLEIITMILDSKGYIKEYDHCEALHLATKLRYLDGIKLLLEHGFNVNYQNKKGTTPLHIAVDGWNFRFKHAYDIIEVLLKAGADPSIADKRGRTPRRMAPDLERLFDLYEVPIKEPDCE